MSVANYKHMKLNMGKKLGTVLKKVVMIIINIFY